MKILITGASGFIGTPLFSALKHKHTVSGIAADDKEKENGVVKCDLLDIEKTLAILHANKITEVDIITHLASVMASSENLNDVQVLNTNNILSENIALLCSHLKAKKLINLSSSSVYPNIDGEFFETSEINPSLNADAIYGLSKFNSEIILNKLSAPQTVLSHLRCVMVYGDGVNPTRIWPVMEKELKEKNTITVFGKGQRLINQIKIPSLCTVIQKFIYNDYPGIFNICEETISLKDLALRIIKEKGNAESKIIEVEKGNKFQFKVNSSKFSKLK